jgi:electron transfer flavoprotein alpha subunit
MSILVLVEHDNQSISSSTRNILTAALAMDKDVTLLVAGWQCEAVEAEAAKLEGVQSVLSVNNECFQHPMPEQLTALLVSLSSSYHVFMAPSTTFGKNVFPRFAAKLDVAQVSDVIDIIDENTFERPIYAGNAIERVRLLDEKKVLTIRTTAFESVMTEQSPCHIESIEFSASEAVSKFIKAELSESSRPDLAAAKVIISGGRGLKSGENFKMIEKLADLLGGAVGASRAAVDAGFVPNDYQVGQTGKIVAPTLYIAIGISGAVQHLAGMKDSKVIVAINKDEDAPIFQIADYGLVGDLFDIVPELITKLEART